MKSPPLISTVLQPGAPAGEEPCRFNGMAPMSGMKPLKRFQPHSSLATWLKPGANEICRLVIGNRMFSLLLSTP